MKKIFFFYFFSFSLSIKMSFLNNLENVVQKPQDVLSGVYSNTGFDMIQVLSRLINRQVK